MESVIDVQSTRFPREFRLLTASDYQFVFDKAVKVQNRAFTLLARENSYCFPRLGLIIAKKNVKTAVKRNWLKRILRESFRQRRASFEHYDMIILTKRDIAVLDKRDIIRLRNELFDKFERKCKQLSSHS